MTANEVYPHGADGRPHNTRDPYQAAREAVPLQVVASRYTELRKIGDKYVGDCPLPGHPDDGCCFSCNPDGRWRCSECGQDGDVIDLAYHCGDYGERWEAMVALAVDYGVDIPKDPRSWFVAQEPHGE